MITDFVQKVYLAYFSVKAEDQDKSWARHRICSSFIEGLHIWSKCKVKSFCFGELIIWREPRNHSNICYFCSCNIQGCNFKDRKEIFYPNIDSALHPVPHGPNTHTPLPSECLDNVLSLLGSKSKDDAEDDFQVESCNELQQFSQLELNDLIRDLAHPKDAAQLLGSRFQEKNLLVSRNFLLFVLKS